LLAKKLEKMAAKMLVLRSYQMLGVADSDLLSFVFGAVNGQFESAFAKLAALHAKNSFSFAIVTGNLFAEDQDEAALTKLLTGQINVACPTYFTVGTRALPPRVVERIEKEEELAPNLYFLAKRSVTKTSEGVRIVTLGGKLDPENMDGVSTDQHLPFHTAEDAKVLKGANSADILLTSLWPAGVWKKSAKEIPVDPLTLSATETIAELCNVLKPRYHFSMSPDDFFFEREPFFPGEPSEDKEKGIPITRFISMASFGNPAKAKSMYAFTVNREAVINAPVGSTISPFYQASTRKRPVDRPEGFSRFQTHEHDNRPRKRRQRSPPPGPDRCYFCISAQNFAKHLVCHIAEDAYLSTAKGPLTSNEVFKDTGLNTVNHLIIAPMHHIPTLSTKYLPKEELDPLYGEMVRYREALQSMISNESKNKLGAVTWEISRENNIHVHWQFMPVPMGLITKQVQGKTMVEAGFEVLAEDYKLGKFQEKDFGLADEMGGNYFRVWIWGEEDDEQNGGRIISKSIVMPFDDSVRFDLQYPRKVMAKLLDLQDRIYWQDIQQSEEEETREVEDFKKAFQPWSFA